MAQFYMEIEHSEMPKRSTDTVCCFILFTPTSTTARGCLSRTPCKTNWSRMKLDTATADLPHKHISLPLKLPQRMPRGLDRPHSINVYNCTPQSKCHHDHAMMADESVNFFSRAIEASLGNEAASTPLFETWDRNAWYDPSRMTKTSRAQDFTRRIMQ